MNYDFRFALTTAAEVREAQKYTKGAAVVVYLPTRFYASKYDTRSKHRYPSKTISVEICRLRGYPRYRTHAPAMM